MGILAGWLSVRHKMSCGSGIPQVKAIIFGYLKDRWRSTLFAKFIGGVLAIAAGLSLGREGPAVQIGACVAQGAGGLMTKSRTERKILIAAGASAGLAAAFNAPLAGVIFVFEEIFRYMSPVILLSTTVATVMATYVGIIFIDWWPVFPLQVTGLLPRWSYWLLIVIGVLTGLTGAFYNRALLAVNAAYGKLWTSKRANIFKPVPIFLISVLVGLAFPLAICGGRLIVGELNVAHGLMFLFALFAIKFAFSIVSFAAGVPGGIFFPLLVLGSIMGSFIGKIAVTHGGMNGEFLVNFMILGMAGLFTATVRAPITGIILLTEMIGSFNHLLPLTVVSIVSYMVANAVGARPIYDSLLENMLGGGRSGIHASNRRMLIDVVVRLGAPAEGCGIKDLELPHQCLILAIKRNGKDVTPHGDTRICANDFLTVLCDSAAEA
ncbi:MAG: chloride channel protein, partial [Synergistaceae bacterium]|nr:chloride channel protein [Synergistaceae bacterium]